LNNKYNTLVFSSNKKGLSDFEELGRQVTSCDGKNKGWVELHAFDDGLMPKYYLKGIKKYIPFYGIQYFNKIKIDSNSSYDELVNLCKKENRADKFLLIDSYQKLPNNFIEKVLDYCNKNETRILKYSIFDK